MNIAAVQVHIRGFTWHTQVLTFFWDATSNPGRQVRALLGVAPLAIVGHTKPKTAVGTHAPALARTQGPVSASEMLVVHTRHVT